MSKIRNTQLIDGDLDPALHSRGSSRTGVNPGKHRRSDHEVLDEIIRYSGMDPLGADTAFNPTFTSSRHERDWILNFLGPFYEEEYLTDVLCQVRGGKEATVYCCQAHPSTGLDLLAAKIYRPRQFRKLRNDSQYKQGRSYLDEFGKIVRDEGQLSAIRKKSSLGKELTHTSWLQHEYHTLRMLYTAGVSVPQPIAQGSNTILMGYLGDVDAPAPTLNTVNLPASRARDLFDCLVQDVETMLSLNRIHGDLSAYNVLYWEGEVKLIDFPQAIDPRQNRAAFSIFKRDVTRLCQYFARYNIRANPALMAQEMWDRLVQPLPEEIPEE